MEPKYKKPASLNVTAPPVASNVPSTFRVPVEIVAVPVTVAAPPTLIVSDPIAVVPGIFKSLVTVVVPINVFVLPFKSKL